MYKYNLVMKLLRTISSFLLLLVGVSLTAQSSLNLKNSQTRAEIKLNRTVTPAAQTPVKSQNATTSNLKARLFWKDVWDRKEHSRI